ncbi:MAG TPA: glycosyltransferase [Phycisphaerae bacterium]|nr:glycosyltransferase [Phycisphaerae bacterium]
MQKSGSQLTNEPAADPAGQTSAWRLSDPELLEQWGRRFPYYSQQLFRLFRQHIPSGSSVLEIGCQLGDLLASLEPSHGVAIDARPKVVEAARQRHPHLTFIQADPAEFDLGGQTFDYIIVSTVLGDIKDLQGLFNSIRKACRSDTRVIIAYQNAAWEPILKFATRLGVRRPTGEQNWLSVLDFTNLLYLADLEVIRKSGEVLFPISVPGVSAFFNRFLVRFWPWAHLGLIQLLIARPIGPPPLLASPRVSVVVPTRNERGNIEGILARTPEMSAGTEIVFVDGNSTDGTADEISRQIAARPDRNVKLILQGDGVGKGDAVRKGFTAATGDILMILDADLTVPPEILPRFVEAVRQGKGEFVNGTRLVYPMEEQAMRFLNKIGNRFFSILFTWLLNQPIRDTLCGTKVLSKAHYEVIARNRYYFGDFDPFGDFDLILGAAKANLRFVEIPVRYESRKYGVTNISRFRHGWLLLKMSWVAFRRLKLR